MQTKVFLSWSGELSRRVAAKIKEWLPVVLQQTDPFFSESDINKGSISIETIISNLKKSKISIIVLTKENSTRPWILFEAGCIVGRGGNACILRIDPAPEETNGPLSQIQQTKLDKNDVYLLISEINKVCKAPLQENILRRAFDSNWPQLERDIEDIKDTLGDSSLSNESQKQQLADNQPSSLVSAQTKTIEDELCWTKCPIHSIKKLISKIDPEYNIEGKRVFRSEEGDTNSGFGQKGMYVLSCDPSVQKEHKLWLIDTKERELLYSYPKPERDYKSSHILSAFVEKYGKTSPFHAFCPFSEHAQNERKEEREKAEIKQHKENEKAIKRFDRFIPHQEHPFADYGKIEFMRRMFPKDKGAFLDLLPLEEAQAKFDNRRIEFEQESKTMPDVSLHSIGLTPHTPDPLRQSVQPLNFDTVQPAPAQSHFDCSGQLPL